MLIRKCDRCGKEIKNNFWTIRIYAETDAKRQLNLESACNNLIVNTSRLKEYCKDCINEIKAFIDKDINN